MLGLFFILRIQYGWLSGSKRKVVEARGWIGVNCLGSSGEDDEGVDLNMCNKTCSAPPRSFSAPEPAKVHGSPLKLLPT